MYPCVFSDINTVPMKGWETQTRWQHYIPEDLSPSDFSLIISLLMFGEERGGRVMVFHLFSIWTWCITSLLHGGSMYLHNYGWLLHYPTTSSHSKTEVILNWIIQSMWCSPSLTIRFCVHFNAVNSKYGLLLIQSYITCPMSTEVW